MTYRDIGKRYDGEDANCKEMVMFPPPNLQSLSCRFCCLYHCSRTL